MCHVPNAHHPFIVVTALLYQLLVLEVGTAKRDRLMQLFARVVFTARRTHRFPFPAHLDISAQLVLGTRIFVQLAHIALVYLLFQLFVLSGPMATQVQI